MPFKNLLRDFICLLTLLLISSVTDTRVYAMNSGGGAPPPAAQVINIDPKDDSCTPVGRQFPSCARACEIDSLGCAKDLLKHVESDAFIRRRQL